MKSEIASRQRNDASAQYELQEILTGRFGPAYLAGALFIAFSMLLRTALFVISSGKAETTLGAIVPVYIRGLVYDTAAALYFVLPVAAFIALMPLWLRRKAAYRHAVVFAFFLMQSLLIFSLASEWVFWDEFEARFNFIAVDYLVYTHEVIDNIMQSYPVAPVIAAIALASALLSWLWMRTGLLKPAHTDKPGPRFERTTALAAFLIMPLLSTLCLDHTTLRPQANQYNAELGMNGIYSLFSAFRNNDLDYERFYAHADHEKERARLRDYLSARNVKFTSPDDHDGVMRHISSLQPEKKMNVVLVMVESLSAQYLGSFGNKQGLTPNLDRLASEGLLFTNVFATGTRTVRGIEAAMLSIPPVPGQSVVRRPFVKDYHSTVPPLAKRGYGLTFVYGGYSYFDNMGAFFEKLGFSVLDRTDIPSEEIIFENAWGVSDEDAFRLALADADNSYKSGKPFFQFVLTTSNHRPFTYPEGRIDIPSKTGRKGGVKYTDYVIGRFIEESSRRPWFKNTVFVIVADHCAGSAGKTEIPIEEHHIPLIIYSPGNIAQGRVESLASQIDLMPTLYGLMGLDYDADFFGVDILARPPGRAFIANYEYLGYIEDGHLVVLGPKAYTSESALDATLAKQPAPPGHKEGDEVEDAIAFYETASRRYVR